MRYVFTGGAGYIGSRLVDFLSRREDTEKIGICDVASPQAYVPKTEFERADVRDRETVRATLERAQPDALIHLAFILNPSHDETLMYDVDVNGTHNVLEAAAAAGTLQVLVTSSTAAYWGVPTTRFRSPRTIRSAVCLPSHTRATDRGRSPLPALGGQIPGPHDHDRPALHGVRPQCRQLPRAPVDQAALGR